jgi:hypothetical protein
MVEIAIISSEAVSIIADLAAFREELVKAIKGK